MIINANVQSWTGARFALCALPSLDINELSVKIHKLTAVIKYSAVPNIFFLPGRQ